MSELSYTTYLRQLNTRLEFRNIVLGVDLNVDYMHLLNQLNLLDQYLYYNSLLVNIGNKEGFNDLSGIESVTVKEWLTQSIEKEKERELNRQVRNLLHIKSSEKKKDSIKPFNIDKLQENLNIFEEEELSDITYNCSSFLENKENLEEPEDDLEEFNLFSLEDEESGSSSSNLLPESKDNTNYTEVESYSDYDETSSRASDYDETYDEYEDEDELPLLGDMYNDLLEANKLLEDDTKDEYDFDDEYTIFDKEDDTESETDFDREGIYNNESGLDTVNTQTKREVLRRDFVVDKTTDKVNESLNKLLTKLAKR